MTATTTTTRWEIINVELDSGVGFFFAETADLALDAFWQSKGFTDLADAASHFLSTPEEMRADFRVQPARGTGECPLRAYVQRRALGRARAV
jgi:hypothetical protein